MKNQTFVVASLLAVSLLVGVSVPVRGENKLLAEFNVASGGEPILLPVTMKGKTYQFLLDTGANRTTFDKKHESFLGSPKQTYQVEMRDGTIRKTHIYYAPDAKVGPLSLETAGAVFCVDLTPQREVIGLPIDGVLGNPFLRKYAVQIDFDAGKVRFYEPNGPMKNWGQATKMQLLPSGVPVVLAMIDKDVQNIMLVDTGLPPTGILPGELFDLLRKEKNIPVASSKYLTDDDKEAEGVVARMNEFQLGDLKYTGLIFDRNPEKASLLGLGFLARHTVTFDYRNDKLYLKKGKEFDRPDNVDMSGLHLLKKNKGVVVHSLDTGSPAVQAGLQAGDILLKIDGTEVGKQTLSKIRRILQRGEGRKVEVVFRRGDKGYKTTITLKKRI